MARSILAVTSYRRQKIPLLTSWKHFSSWVSQDSQLNHAWQTNEVDDTPFLMTFSFRIGRLYARRMWGPLSDIANRLRDLMLSERLFAVNLLSEGLEKDIFSSQLRTALWILAVRKKRLGRGPCTPVMAGTLQVCPTPLRILIFSSHWNNQLFVLRSVGVLSVPSVYNWRPSSFIMAHHWSKENWRAANIFSSIIRGLYQGCFRHSWYLRSVPSRFS